MQWDGIFHSIKWLQFDSVLKAAILNMALELFSSYPDRMSDKTLRILMKYLHLSFKFYSQLVGQYLELVQVCPLLPTFQFIVY
jgi:hypothetical protein